MMFTALENLPIKTYKQKKAKIFKVFLIISPFFLLIFVFSFYLFYKFEPKKEWILENRYFLGPEVWENQNGKWHLISVEGKIKKIKNNELIVSRKNKNYKIKKEEIKKIQKIEGNFLKPESFLFSEISFEELKKGMDISFNPDSGYLTYFIFY